MSLIEKRHGLADTGDSEAFATDPFNYAIVAPRPSNDGVIEIRYDSITYTFNPKQYVGRYDSFVPGIGWDPTFDWALLPKNRAKFNAHVCGLLLGHDPKVISCQHSDKRAYPIVVGGRHTVLARRVQDLILVKLGKKPANIAFRKRVLTEREAAIYTEKDNVTYERDRVAVLQHRLYVAETHEWSDKEAADYYQVNINTWRGWRKAVNDADQDPKDLRHYAPRQHMKKAELASAFERAKKSKAGDSGDLVAMTLEAVLTGKVPEDAEAWFRNIFTDHPD